VRLRLSCKDEDDEISTLPEDEEVLRRTHYYPFGMTMDLPLFEDFNDPENGYLYNGKELNEDFGIDLSDYGARWYDANIGRFHSTDRFSEKYSSMSSYQYGANNPITNIDVNGDSLKISYKGINILYEDGNLFNTDGSEYEGKVRGFLKKSIKALNKIASTETGGDMIGSLQSSNKNIILKYKLRAANFVPGFERFGKPDLMNNAQGLRVQETGEKVLDFFEFTEIGSGGTVYWDPSQTPEGARSTMVLAHELFHGLDATKGMLDSRFISIGGGTSQIQEIRAVYNTNLIRDQLNYKLRSNYSGGPRLLDNDNKPINVSPPYKF
jgi:RHS repeat-associated core domain